MKWKLGYDIGGGHVGCRARLADERWLSVDERKIGENEKSPEQVCAKISLLYADMKEQHGLDPAELESVGVGIPGTIDIDQGVCSFSNNFSWHNVPIKQMLQEIFPGVPIRIDNDANAAAYGEFKAGAGKGCRHFMLLTLGTGVGSGVVINGALYRGAYYGGAEFGHTVIISGGRECTCGRKGCTEAYASATAIIRGAAEYEGAPCANKGCRICTSQDRRGFNAKDVFDAADAGCQASVQSLNYFYDRLTEVIVNAINSFQTEKLAIGGGVAERGQALIEQVHQRIEGKLFARNGAKYTQVVLASFGNDAGAKGAALLDE